MNKQTTNNSQRQGEQVLAKKARVIVLGLDVHADSISVARMVDGTGPQPVQKMTPEQFIRWIPRQLEQAEVVHTCYEAGPFGYGLDRKLRSLGVQNLVIRPKKWDEYGDGVQTDKTDARTLATKLSEYVNGNRLVLVVVRVPTEDEERRRLKVRQREQLKDERKRMEAQGRSLMLSHGYRIRGQWWKDRPWAKLKRDLPDYLVEALGHWRGLILAIDEERKELEEVCVADASETRAKGMGAYTEVAMDAEICNWNRFKNRRQVASYFGLCGRVSSSGKRRMDGSLTKHGNKRLRTWMIELAWRMVRYQSQYPPIQRWADILVNGKGPAGKRKKAICAVARRLAIDIWRARTGQGDLAELGLNLKVA